MVNVLGVILLANVDFIKWKKAFYAFQYPKVALGRPLPGREKDTPMIGALGTILLGHVDLDKWYKAQGSYTCLPRLSIPCHYRVGLIFQF